MLCAVLCRNPMGTSNWTGTPVPMDVNGRTKPSLNMLLRSGDRALQETPAAKVKNRLWYVRFSCTLECYSERMGCIVDFTSKGLIGVGVSTLCNINRAEHC
jgi:hypothetical protein